MSEDKCRPVVVDGEVIRVHGGAEMDATDLAYFAGIVRAAKRHPSNHPEPPVGAKQGSIPDRNGAPVAERPDATDGSSVSGTPNTPGKADGGGRELRPSPVVGTWLADEPRPCPDCAAGAHHACDGCTWDGGLTACPCSASGHL